MASRCRKIYSTAAVVVLLLAGAAISGCDRGASNEIGVAKKFADAVARNDTTARDTMIATAKFREYFNNPYVSHDMLSWFRSFYDYRKKEFTGAATADVDRNLESELAGSLNDTNRIEETGMVKVKNPVPGEDAAFFWMVKQEGKPWKVAIVTKGEAQVNFNQ
ncbi:MAG TPA: hypothetical protein VG537_07990 [Candidatus Kapabacteria bacterium]|nr:hypothetical protein [Candidatus Kapabacteria bacterium]